MSRPPKRHVVSVDDLLGRNGRPTINNGRRRMPWSWGRHHKKNIAVRAAITAYRWIWARSFVVANRVLEVFRR